MDKDNAKKLLDLLDFTVNNRASDLHLSAGLPPMFRIDGELKLFDEPTVCNTSSCPYFCMKFSSKYNNKKLIKQKSTQMLGRMSNGVYK